MSTITQETLARHGGPLRVGRSVANKPVYRGPRNEPSEETLLKRAQEARTLSRGTCSECHLLLPANGECC